MPDMYHNFIHSPYVRARVGRSPTNQDHGPVLHMLQLPDPGVLFLFAPDSHANDVKQLHLLLLVPEVALSQTLCAVHLDLLHRLPRGFVDRLAAVEAAAHHIAQADLGVSKQADLEIAVGRDSEAVTAAAEMVRHACDEADSALEAGDLKGLAGVVGVVLDLVDAGMLLPYHGEHLLIAEHLLRGPLVAGKWHVFNEAHLEILVLRHLDKRENLVVVEAADDDGVDFELYPCARLVHLQYAIYALHDLFESSSSCHNFELKRIKCVQTEVDAGDARFDH